MRRSRLIACGLVGLALAFRLALALGMPNDEPDDGLVYSLLAHNVNVHHIYSNDEEEPYSSTYVRVPGYPFFLAAIYQVAGDRNNTAVRVLQALIDTFTCVVVAAIALVWSPRRWPPGRRRRAGLMALGLAAVCPFVAIYVTTLLTEVLATALGMTLLLTTSLAAVGDRHGHFGWLGRLSPRVLWCITGAVGGVMTLVRPESGLYVGAAGLVMLIVSLRSQGSTASPVTGFVRRALSHGLALSIPFVIVLTPWTVRNSLVFGTFEPLNPRSLSMPGEFVAWGYAEWLRSWIDHPRYVGPILFSLDRDPITIDEVPDRAFDSPAERAEVARLLEKYNVPAPDAEVDPATGHVPPGGMTPELDAAFGAIGRERAARHPLRQYLVLPLQRAVMLWFDPHADYYPFGGYLFPWAQIDRDRAQQIWLPLFTAIALLWTIAGWAGAVVLARGRDGWLWLLLSALVILPRLALLSSMENPEPRYTMEFFPVVTILAAMAMAWPIRTSTRAPSFTG